MVNVDLLGGGKQSSRLGLKEDADKERFMLACRSRFPNAITWFDWLLRLPRAETETHEIATKANKHVIKSLQSRRERNSVDKIEITRKVKEKKYMSNKNERL